MLKIVLEDNRIKSSFVSEEEKFITNLMLQKDNLSFKGVNVSEHELVQVYVNGKVLLSISENGEDDILGELNVFDRDNIRNIQSQNAYTELKFMVYTLEYPKDNLSQILEV